MSEIDFSSVIPKVLSMTNLIKIYHWQTLSHPRHVSSNDLYNEFNDLVDKFIEVLTGILIVQNNDNKYRLKINNKNIQVLNVDDDMGIDLLKKILKELKSDYFNQVIGTNTELSNIRDELFALVNKNIYLFTMN
jgi:hypothetical protein